MGGSIVLQRPDGPADRLVLLFHGVGASADDMAPVGEAIAARCPTAFVVSVDAPQRSDFNIGRQWFSLQGVSDAIRAARVAEALPGFIALIEQWQRTSGLGPAATLLVGFSQGSIMALAATQLPVVPARAVIAVAGRFAQPPQHAPQGCTLHLIHGEQDTVIPARCSVEAAEQLRALGASVSLDLFPGLGHGIDERALACLLDAVSAG